jgi:hypothetical protein
MGCETGDTMRSVLAKAVRKRFEQQIRKRLASLEPDPTAIVPQGWRVFSWSARPDLTFYLVLCIDPQHDSFTVEGAWSRTSAFPGYGGLQYPKAWPEREIREDEPSGGQFRFRLAHLWQPRDHWWWLVPEAEVKAQTDKFADAGMAGDPDIYAGLEDLPLEEAQSNVLPMVDDAIEKIMIHAVPYFKQIKDRLL